MALSFEGHEAGKPAREPAPSAPPAEPRPPWDPCRPQPPQVAHRAALRPPGALSDARCPASRQSRAGRVGRWPRSAAWLADAEIPARIPWEGGLPTFAANFALHMLLRQRPGRTRSASCVPPSSASFCAHFLSAALNVAVHRTALLRARNSRSCTVVYRVSHAVQPACRGCWLSFCPSTRINRGGGCLHCSSPFQCPCPNTPMALLVARRRQHGGRRREGSRKSCMRPRLRSANASARLKQA